MTIITNDGVLLTGTPSEILQQLQAQQRLDTAPDVDLFMIQVASRVRLWNGERLRYHDSASFLDGLCKAELIDILEP